MKLNEASIDDGVGLTLSWLFKMYPFSPSHSHTVKLHMNNSCFHLYSGQLRLYN